MKLIAELQMASLAKMTFFLFKSELLIRVFFCDALYRIWQGLITFGILMVMSLFKDSKLICSSFMRFIQASV